MIKDKFKLLKKLEISRFNGHTGIKHLTDLKNLTSLTLTYAGSTSFLYDLKFLTNLKHLNLSNSKAVLPSLKDLVHLKSLDLSYCTVDFSIHQFQGMKDLKKLILFRSTITGMKNLDDFINLESLDICSNFEYPKILEETCFEKFQKLKILKVESFYYDLSSLHSIIELHAFLNFSSVPKYLLSKKDLKIFMKS